MDAERWQRVRELFDRLVELPQAQWDAQLAAACDGDAELEREVLALLAADTDTRIEPSDLAVQGMALLADIALQDEASERDRLAGTRLGRFRLLHQIGRGGMGAVWLAERADGEFAQKVAIKLIRSGWDEAEIHARFRAERQILAGLQHPHIAHLIDGGVTPDGKPWLALEHVDGIDLRRYGDLHRLNLRRRLDLFLAVCEAVAYAHARLVVHRDLKPSNILVRGDGTVKLLDFGIAKLIDAESTQASMVRAFTPEYAAPEQIRGEPVTTAVDIYALGMLLYELLTGRHPYRLEEATPSAYERAVLDQAPTRPSQMVVRDGTDGAAAALAANRHLTPQRLRRDLRGDLDAIVLKALRKEPEQRYASVQDLAADLRAWSQHRPVAARRGGWRYGATRFLRRHALASGMALFAMAALVAGLAIAVWQERQTRLQRDMAIAESAKSRAALEFMSGLFELADPGESRGENVTARELLVRGTERIQGQLSEQPAVRAELLSAMASAQLGLGLHHDALPLAKEAHELARSTNDVRLHYVTALRYAEALQHFGQYHEVLGLLDPLRETLAPGREMSILRAEVDFRRGLALQAVNRFEEADLAYTNAYDARLRLYGAADRRTQETALPHVSLLVLLGRMQAAEHQARTTLVAVRRSTSETDPHRANAISTLAMVLTNTGPLSEAEALRREELHIRQVVLGPDHSDTVLTMSNLAAVLYAQRGFAAAAEIYRSVLRQRRAQHGDLHPSIAAVAQNLAACESELNDPHAAKDLAEEALRIRLAHYGPDHHSTAASFHLIGSVELDLGLTAAAEGHLQQAIESYEAAYGAKTGRAIGPLRDLARAQVLLGHVDPACGAAERAHEISMARGQEEPDSTYISAIRAACWVSTGRTEGMAVLADNLETLHRHWGADDRRTRKIVALAQAADRNSQRPSGLGSP